MKLFTAVIYGFSKSARVFVPDKPFQPSLGLPIRLEPTQLKHLSGAPLKGRLLASPTNTGQVGKTYQGQTR
jgi:hypothetical protein